MFDCARLEFAPNGLKFDVSTGREVMPAAGAFEPNEKPPKAGLAAAALANAPEGCAAAGAPKLNGALVAVCAGCAPKLKLDALSGAADEDEDCVLNSGTAAGRAGAELDRGVAAALRFEVLPKENEGAAAAAGAPALARGCC